MMTWLLSFDDFCSGLLDLHFAQAVRAEEA